MKLNNLLFILVGCLATTLALANETYDHFPISPQTWEELDLTYINHLESKDYTEQANLLRPVNWIKQNHLDKIGSIVHLTKAQFGEDIDVKIIAIKPNNLTYANNDKGTTKPVIGTFIKHSDDVWNYTLNDKKGNTETIEATSNHPFYSIDRHTYIPIGEIRLGERLKTENGSNVSLISKTKHNLGVEIVYNFEVYQAHNYLVGNSAVLVHNMSEANCDIQNSKEPDQINIKNMTQKISAKRTTENINCQSCSIGFYKSFAKNNIQLPKRSTYYPDLFLKRKLGFSSAEWVDKEIILDYLDQLPASTNNIIAKGQVNKQIRKSRGFSWRPYIKSLDSHYFNFIKVEGKWVLVDSYYNKVENNILERLNKIHNNGTDDILLYPKNKFKLYH